MILLIIYKYSYFPLLFNEGILKIPGNKLITNGYNKEINNPIKVFIKGYIWLLW